MGGCAIFSTLVLEQSLHWIVLSKTWFLLGLQENDVAVLERYCGAAGFLTSLGESLQVYLENLAASFPNQQNMESSELYTFIQVLSPYTGGTAACKRSR